MTDSAEILEEHCRKRALSGGIERPEPGNVVSLNAARTERAAALLNKATVH